MSVISPVQSHNHEGSEVSREEKLRWEGFVAKIRFEPGVKKWRSDGCWEWWWWQRWVDKWKRWIQTGLTRLTKWIWKLIPKASWCISKRAICDFQWGDGWWARKGDNSWGAYIFQQDSACQKIELLQLETPKFIALDLGPPSSHDLLPVDYQIWGVMQGCVYQTPVQHMADLRQCLVDWRLEWLVTQHCG